MFNYSRPTAFRTLALGEGLFWERRDEKRGATIKIYGLAAVSEYLNTSLRDSKRFYEVPAEKFRTLGQRRTQLWVSTHRPKGVHADPISRQSLEEITGVQERQQRRYDKAGKAKRTPNFRPGCEQPRLPNTYHNQQYLGIKGMLPKVRRELKAYLLDEPFEKQRYFGSIRKLLKSKHKTELAYTLIRSDKRQIKGRLEWQPILTMG